MFCRLLRAAPTAFALILLAASPSTLLAQSSYYDPVRDVMVPVIDPPQSPYAQPSAASEPAPRQYNLLIRNGWLTTGPTQISVDHGAEVLISAKSNVADLLMIDGYDIKLRLVAGQPVLLRFTAEAPGRFDYRLASSGRVIGVIEVGPPAAPQSTRPGGDADRPRPIH